MICTVGTAGSLFLDTMNVLVVNLKTSHSTLMLEVIEHPEVQ